MAIQHIRLRITGIIDIIAESAASPASLPDLAFWISADKITGKSNDDAITVWNDSSGNARDFSGNGIYKTNVLNGLPGIYLNGTQTMNTTYVLDNPCSVFGLVKVEPGSGQRIIGSNDVNWLLGNWGGNQEQYFAGDWIYNPVVVLDLNPHLWSCTQTGSLCTFWGGATQLASNGNANDAPGQLLVGGGNDENSTCTIFELLAYSRVLDAGEISLVQNFLLDKYNL